MTRMRTLVAGSLCAALATTCTSADDVLDTTTQAGDLPGTGLSRSMYPLMNPSLTPLAPVNSVTKAIFTQACISKPDGSGPDPGDFFKQAGGGTTYVKFAKSRSAVDDALAVKVSAAFAGPTAGLSAEVEASVETSTRAESVYLLGELFAYTHQVLAATCPLVLTENATTLLLDDDAFGDVPEADRARYRAAAFMRTCGDGFVQTRLLGAGGTLIMEWRSKSAEDKAKIRAELEASFGKPVIGGKIGVAAALSRNKLAASATLTTTLVAQGAIPGMPAPGDIDTDPSKLNDVVSKIDELKQKLAENGSDVTNLVPMAARLSAYD